MGWTGPVGRARGYLSAWPRTSRLLPARILAQSVVPSPGLASQMPVAGRIATPGDPYGTPGMAGVLAAPPSRQWRCGSPIITWLR
jgi:hypothetical protein